MSNLAKSKKPQAQKKNPIAQGSDEVKQAITNDSRFKAVHFDPRFASAPKQTRKFKIDPRFGQVLSDSRFKTVSKVDKYGRKVDVPKTNKEMENFYYLEDGEQNGEEDPEEQAVEDEIKEVPRAKSKIEKQQNGQKKENTNGKGKKNNEKPAAKGQNGKKNQAQKPVACFDEDGNFEWNEQSSSASDFEDIDLGLVEEENMDDALWESEDDDIPTGDATKRLALINYDWENIKASDIMLFLTSFAPRGGFIRSVTTYPSEFGLERMAQEEKLGPQGIWRDSKKGANVEEHEENELELDADAPWVFRDNTEGDIDPVKLRKYERERLRYYFAIIECDSAQTARNIYEECDGLEMELTSIKIDLRYVPDSETFKREPKEVCTDVPTGATVNCFLNRSMQHTNVKLTWDEPKPNRFKELDQKNIDDYDNIDLGKYIASSDSSDDADSEDDEEEIARKKALLLGSLSKDWKSDFDKGKRAKRRDEEIIIKFNPGFDELGNKILEKANPEKPKKKNPHVKVNEKDDYFAEEEVKESKEDKEKNDAALALMIDENDAKKKGAFKVNFADTRFKGIYDTTRDYQIDPTSKHFNAETNKKWLEKQTTGRKKLKTN
jgi:hypothetical protein